jgi:hypothetical protein
LKEEITVEAVSMAVKRCTAADRKRSTDVRWRMTVTRNVVKSLQKADTVVTHVAAFIDGSHDTESARLS